MPTGFFLRHTRALSLALAFAAGVPGVAAESTAPEPDTDTDPAAAPATVPVVESNPFVRCRQPRDAPGLLDRTRGGLHQTVCGAALWFDGLFGERDLDAARGSYGDVSITTGYSQFDGSETRLRFNARLQLPAMDQRLSLFVGRGDDEDFTRDRVEGEALRPQADPPGERDEFVAGVGIAAFRGERFQSQFRIGVQDLRLPKVFVQNRFGYLPLLDERNRIYLRLTPFWNNRDRFGATAGADADRVLAERLVLRWGNTATRTERSAGLDWRSAVILYQRLQSGNALAYETFIRGQTRAPEPVQEYGVRVVYRHGLFAERMFLELAPGYSWPRIDPTLAREGSAGISLSIELPFGEELRPPPGDARPGPE